MKRLICLITSLVMAISSIAQLYAPSAKIEDNLKGYKYVYVVPTNGITSNSGIHSNSYGVYGGPTKTINPSETIKGYFIRLGYTCLASIDPNLANITMIVSFGQTGRRMLSPLSSAYSSGIIIQISNAKTHKVLATYQAEGCGSDETEDITQALYSALRLFPYSLSPKIDSEILRVQKNSIKLSLTNKTPFYVRHILLRLTYYLDGELIHEQMDGIKTNLLQGNSINIRIKRDKIVRSSKYQVKVDVVEYK